MGAPAVTRLGSTPLVRPFPFPLPLPLPLALEAGGRMKSLIGEGTAAAAPWVACSSRMLPSMVEEMTSRGRMEKGCGGREYGGRRGVSMSGRLRSMGEEMTPARLAAHPQQH